MKLTSTYIPTPTQTKAHSANERYKLFGGAMGGGKSRWLCEEAKELCMQYPGNRILMCRYHLSDFKNTTLKTLIECFPPELIISHNQADHIIRLINGSEILYLGLSEEENVSKIKSMELGAFLLDEASEIAREHFLLLQSRLRRRLPNGTFPRYYGLLATNPADCWLKDDFVLGRGGLDYTFIPSLPRDNPYLPEDYEAQLRKTYPADWVAKFLEGSWDELTGGDKVIPSDWVRAAVNREVVVEDRVIISADIARFGDDEIVIYVGKGPCIVHHDISLKKSTMETAGHILALKKKYSARLIVVDDVNVGGGVVDRLKEQGERVLGINGGSSPTDPRFQNLKSQIWWHARMQFQDGVVSIINDPILIRQLSSIKFNYRSNGKIMIEPKKEVKTRLGQSPDRADSLVLMLWGLTHIKDPHREFIRREAFQDKDTKNPYDYGWGDYNYQEQGVYQYDA